MGTKRAEARVCRVCGKEIGKGRLEVLPETTMCVDCARVYPPAAIDVAKLDLSEASPITRNGFGPKD